MSERFSLTGDVSLTNPLLRLEEGSDDGSEDQEAIRTRALLFGSGSPKAVHAGGPYAAGLDGSSSNNNNNSNNNSATVATPPTTSTYSAFAALGQKQLGSSALSRGEQSSGGRSSGRRSSDGRRNSLNDGLNDPARNFAYEILFGPSNEHAEYDPERRAVDQLLERNPKTFPPLCPQFFPGPRGSYSSAADFAAAVRCYGWAYLFAAALAGGVVYAALELPDEVLQLVSIPLISCVFTYFHIWLALWMMFYPMRFVGVLRIPGTNVGLPGWQGIVPSKAMKMIGVSWCHSVLVLGMRR